MQVLKLNKKRKFDIDSKKDIDIFKTFLTTNSWKFIGTCPFEVEHPHLSVPDMIKDKLIRKYLKLSYD